MKPLRDAMISVQKVARSKAIQVHNMNKIKSGTLELYFENERHSGGGQCRTIMTNENQDSIILEFENPFGRFFW